MYCHGYFDKLIKFAPEIKDDAEIVTVAARNLNATAVQLAFNMLDEPDMPISTKEWHDLDLGVRKGFDKQELSEYLDREKQREEDFLKEYTADSLCENFSKETIQELHDLFKDGVPAVTGTNLDVWKKC